MKISKWYYIVPNPEYCRKKAHILNKDNSLYTLCGLRTFQDDYLVSMEGGIGFGYEDDICKVCSRQLESREQIESL